MAAGAPLEEPSRPLGLGLRPEVAQRSRACASRSATSPRPRASRLWRARSWPGRPRTARAALEAIGGVFEERPGPLVVAARGGQHPLGQVGAGAQRRRPTSRSASRSASSAAAPRRARRGRARVDQQLERGTRSSLRSPGACRSTARQARPLAAASPRSSARRARQSCAARPSALRAAAPPPPSVPAVASAPRARPAGPGPAPGASGRSPRPPPRAGLRLRPTGPARGAPPRTPPGRTRACSGSRSAPRTRQSGRTTRTLARSRAPPCRR